MGSQVTITSKDVSNYANKKFDGVIDSVADSIPFGLGEGLTERPVFKQATENLRKGIDNTTKDETSWFGSMIQSLLGFFNSMLTSITNWADNTFGKVEKTKVASDTPAAAEPAQPQPAAEPVKKAALDANAADMPKLATSDSPPTGTQHLPNAKDTGAPSLPLKRS